METAGIFARESSRLGRYVQVGMVGSRVISVSFPETPDEEAAAEHPLLDRIVDYLDGETDDFTDVDLGLTLPTDQRAVLEEVRSIPYGESATVEAVARTTAVLERGEEGESVVRSALRENPTPLVIPGHRVVDGPAAEPAAVNRRLREIEGL